MPLKDALNGPLKIDPQAAEQYASQSRNEHAKQAKLINHIPFHFFTFSYKAQSLYKLKYNFAFYQKYSLFLRKVRDKKQYKKMTSAKGVWECASQ